MTVDTAWIDQAFPPSSQAPLNSSVRDALKKDPHYNNLFKDIGSYIVSLKSKANGDEPALKKRKLENETITVREPPSAPAAQKPLGKPTTEGAVLTVKDLSFTVPQRKKFSLVVTPQSICAVKDGDAVEFGAVLDDIQYVTCLPVPDKAARQWNFCIFPNGAEGLGNSTADAIVFTIPDGAPKTAVGDAMGAGYDTTSYRSLLLGVFNKFLAASDSPISAVEEPNEKVFHSALPQSHRKGEKAFHVKAHRGSKEGYLFFLERGILWAFKKPLIYFSFGAIDSVSYTSITKRTFNLSIHVSEEMGGAEIEFGMIDQEDYINIDYYIKTHQLNNASMAAARRAKYFHVNGKKEDAESGAGQSELDKAMADAAVEAEGEDSEGEDYVPGKDEGEEGSGSGEEGDSDDDDDDDSDEAGSEDMGSEDEGSVDLAEELGSEMEDVEPEKPREKRKKR